MNFTRWNINGILILLALFISTLFANRRNEEDSVAVKEFLLALREADQRAIEIKNRADEQARNNLRAQIERERGDYVTRDDLAAQARKHSDDIESIRAWFELAHKPVVAFMTQQEAIARSREGERERLRSNLNVRLVIAGIIISVVVIGVNVLLAVF